MVDRCSEVLTKLAQNVGRGRHEGQSATTALDSLAPPDKRAGRASENVVWREKVRRIDFSSQALQIGGLRYNAVDFGDSIPLPSHLQKALGEPNKEETNQCVMLHLAGAYEWKSQNCPNRVPSKSRINVVSSEFRQLEYRSALRFVSTVEKPQSQREHELWSVAHDAVTPNHDRRFRELSTFLSTSLLRNDEVLRIFDIEECDACVWPRTSPKYRTGSDTVRMGRAYAMSLPYVDYHCR